MLRDLHFSTDHAALLDSLAATENLLIIQDLDGVCMGLVSDPLTRRIERSYVEASRQLSGHFYVLTNGEHVGRRGVNSIVEQAFDDPDRAREQGLYLPGLAGGGVQLQDEFGEVSHPGVSDAELRYLAALPERAAGELEAFLTGPPLSLDASARGKLVATCILDNAVSPTLNLNPLYAVCAGDTAAYVQCQRFAEQSLRKWLADAASAGLADSFFLHFAPNLGRDAGGERVRYSDGTDAGTTDFQFMLNGAVKEVGVLVLLNHYWYRHYGHHPLGAGFNAREAPSGQEALAQLAAEHFPAAQMPRLVGVGDTVTSHRAEGDSPPLRGGSDRGFLTLIQTLGATFGQDNLTLFIDSSRGEVRRPGVDAGRLHGDEASHWAALRGITDPEDPLRLNFLFSGGHTEYTTFFGRLAAGYADRHRLSPG